MAPHLLTDDYDLCDRMRSLCGLKQRSWLSKPSALACFSSRHAWAGGRARLESPSEMKQVAALRMIARVCAGERGLGLGSACGGGSSAHRMPRRIVLNDDLLGRQTK